MAYSDKVIDHYNHPRNVGSMDKASAEHKVVLLDFTGSDWCGWCKRLKAEVFDQPEFAEFAQANLIMVEVDFPRNKPETAAAKVQTKIINETANGANNCGMSDPGSG